MNIYVAHFSFSLDPTTNHPLTGGHLTAVVQASNLTKALEKFRPLLDKVQAQTIGLKAVYLNSVTEMKAVPKAGLITFLQFDTTDGGSLDASNVGADDNPDVAAYGINNRPGTAIEQPFITF